MTTYSTVPEGLFYMVDLTDFTSHLARAEESELQAYGKVLYDEFFVPIAKEGANIGEEATLASQDTLNVDCSLVNTPGDAAILVFTCPPGSLPFDYLVDSLIKMTRKLAVRLPDTAAQNIALRFGMDVGPFVKCGEPFMGGAGISTTGSTDMSFIPSFIIGNPINRLARILSSPAQPPDAPRISAELREKMSGYPPEHREGKDYPILDYPDKGCTDRRFCVLEPTAG